MQSKRLLVIFVALVILVGVVARANWKYLESSPEILPQRSSDFPRSSPDDLRARPFSPELSAPPEPPWYSVARVVDGDTVVLEMNGTLTTVRLIGLDTPEVVDPHKPVQCFGPEASIEAKRLLDGQTVRFEADPTQDARDRYGRALGYIFLPDGANFDELMIAQGYGREYTFKKPYLYQNEFRAAEVEARHAGRGLWAPGVCF